jgi:hypothetical protein
MDPIPRIQSSVLVPAKRRVRRFLVLFGRKEPSVLASGSEKKSDVRAYCGEKVLQVLLRFVSF